MSTINIEVLDVKVENKGKSNHMTVTHKDCASGKLDGKKLVEFYTDKAVWEALAASKAGTFFSVDREKTPDGKFWTWKALSRQDSPPVATVSVPETTARTRSTYETPEERQARQVMIVRQSSISSAVELCKDHGKQPDPELVIRVAKQFEAYVLSTGVADMESDVPL